MIDNASNLTQSQPAQDQPQAQPQPVQPQSVPNTQPQAQTPTQTAPVSGGMVTNAGAAQPQVTAMTEGTQLDPAAAKAKQHASIVRTMAETLAGGPRFKTTIDPQTGQRTLTRVPLSRSDIGMAIAMSAITGALSGLQAKGPNATAQAAARGFDATATARQNADQQADQKAQQDYENQAGALARKSALMEHNLHMAQLTAALGHDSENDLQKHVDSFADMRDEQGTPAIADVSENDLRTKYAGQAGKLGQMATQYLALPSRVIPRLDSDGNQMKNADGVPQYELLWNLYDQTKQMPLSQEFLDKAASYGVPGAIKSDGTPFKISDGATISAPAYARMIRQIESIDLLQRDVREVAEATKSQPADVKSLVRSGQLSTQAINQYFRDHGAATNPAEAVQLMKADPKANSYAPSVIAAFGPDAFEKYKTAQKANEEATVAGEKKKAELAAEPMTDDKAASILSDPNSTPVQRSRAANFQKIKAAQKTAQKQNELAADQAVRQGDPQDAGKLLYNGTLTLSELKARSVTPKFIEDATNAALTFARANGENNWTPQTGEAQFNAAKSTQNVQFFGSANSLLDKDGTLNQLSQQYAKLGNGKIPIFNKWEDYAKYQAGDPALAGFMQTAVGVADDYAKVMGGGTGSDTSRLQVMQSFANAHNPQQMQAALDAARNAVRSQVSARIGSNRVMRNMYGQNLSSGPAQQPRVVPAGATPGRDAQGNIIGYRTADGRVVRF